MAIIGRLLEAQGFRVGMISQPDWSNADAFKTLGKPNLFCGVTAGNMDSMVNRYTSDRRFGATTITPPAARAANGPTAPSSSMPSAAARRFPERRS